MLWALLRREWRFAAAFAATASWGLAGSIMAYGFANHVDYLRVLEFLAERGETFYPNQSVNGLLNRVMVLVDPERVEQSSVQRQLVPAVQPAGLWRHACDLDRAALGCAVPAWQQRRP